MPSTPSPEDKPANITLSAPRIVITKVFVRALKVEAEIGIYAHEKGKRQPLVLDVELDVAVGGWSHIADTVNYETIRTIAKDIARTGHIGLVEAFAEAVAKACCEDPRVTRARVRVEKPGALAPDAAAAGVEVIAVRS